MKKHICILFKIWIGILAIFILQSCDSSEQGSFAQVNDEEFIFNASVVQSEAIKTRADSTYITHEFYPDNFYIRVESDADINYGTYYVPPGYDGRLYSVESQTALNWHDLTSEHTFIGWTIPWPNDYYENGVDDANIPVTFYDSSESNYSLRSNNSVYETFIGCKSGPYSYVNRGKYVDLTFYHLVSKIKIGVFQLTEASGAIQRNLKAEITFINMPTTGNLVITPEEGIPYIDMDQANESEGITYFIANNPREQGSSFYGSDTFYIPPELDFSTIDFQVKLMDAKYASYNIYYGTFDEVEFVRTPGNDYDQGEGADDTVLHAGEQMTININLIPGKGPGLKLVVDKWSTEQPNESRYYPYPGLYSEAQLSELLDAFLSQHLENGVVTTDNLDYLFSVYGKEIDDINYFLLYENIDISSFPTGNFFPIWKEYILNGLGHIITMKLNSFGNHFSGAPYFNIGPMRNVYLTGTYNGTTYKMYIDENGFTYTYDATTDSYIKTNYQLTELTGNDYSYNINPATGEVKPVTYYNLQPGLNT